MPGAGKHKFKMLPSLLLHSGRTSNIIAHNHPPRLPQLWSPPRCASQPSFPFWR
ncbi:uncharacterized protein BO66DRAFT_121897 [Aspergillus aculeatinus CBS 121060]|uniref:Uncharacterized protein n=1 Tax=Aspergillus aculeatinus CBS 121060 TaxID=1448322 RepID=A0ACD1H5J5_9EURO|nr:hypothetical protein BO66DRAFT_121897 [Aspergillus aculeatinus CBS 121060]RAH68849.1 hypothetical protein BO66DRAFT_121897 [Aspergillus aculeatinus CBS 121060]